VAAAERATVARRPRGAPAAGSSYALLLVVVGILLAFGVVMVLSASSLAGLARRDDPYVYFKRHVLWTALGVAVMFAASRVDYRRWRLLAAPLLLAAVVALLLVLVHPRAVSAYGSTRWIPLGGGLTFQPAELAKLALLLFCADVLTRKAKLLDDVRHLLVPVVPVLLLLAALVMAEPDLGTTILLVVIAFGMLFLAGAPLFVLASLTAVGVLGALGTLRGYQRQRIESFLHPDADPLGRGLQLIQGHRALGSGGFLGVGLGQSKAKWGFLPNAHQDFIFAVIGEELGLLGALAIITLFLLLAYAGVRVARRAPDRYGRYLAGGITLWITVQAIVNIGAVVGVLPITGIPLPFVSYGGSSLVGLLASVGMLLNVARQEVVRGARRPVVATVAARHGRRLVTTAPARARPAPGRPARPAARQRRASR
jgi:cell division protein FtsW